MRVKAGMGMKIGMIGHKQVPSREGGIEIAVEETALHLAAAGHQVDCYDQWQGFSRRGDRAPREYRGTRLVRIPTLSHPSLNTSVYSVLAAIHAVFGGHDVLHFHVEGPGATTFLPRLLGTPVVATIHGLGWQRAKWGKFVTRYLLWGEKNVARYSNALVTLSHENQHYFMDTYGRESVYIPNGMEMIPCREPEGIGRGWDLRGDTYIFFLSRLVPEKGLHYLLKAYKNMNTQTRLVIAGEPTKNNDYIDRMHRMAEGNEGILFTGLVQGRVLEELMSSCRVYVLPGDIRGMFISLLEVVSCGARCLVSDIGENVETAGGYAGYFLKGNAPVLGSCLESMLGEVENLRDRERQVSFVRERYNRDTAVQELLHVYENVRKKTTIQI